MLQQVDSDTDARVIGRGSRRIHSVPLVRQVRLTRSPSPSKCDCHYRKHGLGAYFEVWSEVVGKVCRRCFAGLPAITDPRREYCDHGDPNPAKQKGYRERHPDAVFDNQVRYKGQFAADE